MKSEKVVFWGLAIFALTVLGAAAVWFGGLNQDEGWYLYAANLVADGQMPFRDFQYTQGPVMPCVYSFFAWIWTRSGILGARVFTLLIGLSAIAFFAGTAAKLARKNPGLAALAVVFLLGCNLYHLYYVAIPKTYALASLFVALGFWLLATGRRRLSPVLAGLSLALASGTRISLGAILCVVGCALLFRREWRTLIPFCIGGFLGLALVYGPFLVDSRAFDGLVAAQRYHAARGGFDPVWVVGSLSRLVRWYLPVFMVLGLGVFGKRDAESAAQPSASSLHPVLVWSFLAVFAVQMLAPFPYEDYQVPIMGLLAVFAAVRLFGDYRAASSASNPAFAFPTCSLLLVFGLAYATSFGSPLLEKWMTNGQDRFWSLKKEKGELAQLREVARRIEKLDPKGTTLLTQDTYLAIETNRRVPRGLEMGPFSVLSDADWQKLLSETAPAECAVAALSGYTFAVEPPRCGERAIDRQMAYWGLLKRNFELAEREEAFGQNATPLLILKRKR